MTNGFDSDANKEVAKMQWFLNMMKNTQKIGLSYKRTTDRYCPYDGVLFGPKSKWLVEVKVRIKYSMDTINRMGGQVLEWKKLNGMIEAAKGTAGEGLDNLYFVFFSDGLGVWKLKGLDDYAWTNSMYQANNQGSGEIAKRTVDLPPPTVFYPYKQQQ